MNAVIKMEGTIIPREQQRIQSKGKVLGAVMAFGVIDFWFGIEAILAAKTVHSVKEFISRKCQ